ncbi:MAG: cell division protein ZapE [Amphritea sp.]
MNASFQAIYQQMITQQDYQSDPAQNELVVELDRLYQLLHQSHWRMLDAQGIYIWGSVGRGKTFLMDLFFAHIPKGSGLRLHFHRFMERIHRELRQEQGHKEPLNRIASRLAKECKVICFDEFYLNDIGDAMILGRLLKALFSKGVVLISTSNRPPDELYTDTLYQDRIQPIIKMIQQQLVIKHLDGAIDHRLRTLTLKQNYFLTTNEQPLHEHFANINQRRIIEKPVIILGREIIVRKRSTDIIWFDFSALCEGPRSQLDYIELARHYHTIILSNIPPLGGIAYERIKARGTEDGSSAVRAGDREVILARMDDPARRFISLIDELYDRCVNLFLSAVVPLDQLYIEGSLMFEFARTHSRLVEMQSVEYQSRPHQS